MSEHENHLFRLPDQNTFQAPPSLVPTLLARLGLDEPSSVPDISLEGLRKALATPDWTVRTGAVQSLANLSDRESFDLLLSALHDEDVSVRSAAVRVLGQRGDPADRVVIERLEAALRDPAWHVRETAVYALGTMNASVSISVLREFLHDSDDEVRLAAMQVIERFESDAHREDQESALCVPEQAHQIFHPFFVMWVQLIQRFVLRLVPHSFSDTGRELNMLDEKQDVTNESLSAEYTGAKKPEKHVSVRLAVSRRPWLRLLEQGLAVLLILGIAVGWFAISRLSHSSTGVSVVFNDASVPPLGAPASTYHGNVSYVQEWSADSRTFFYLQIDSQKHALEVRMLDAATGRSIIHPVLDSSWVAALNQYNIFQVGHYLIALRPHGKKLATMEIWDITGQRTVTVQSVPARNGENGQVLSPVMASSDNEQKFAMFSPDGTITIWDIASGQKLVTLEGKISYTFPIPPFIKWYDHDQYLLFSDRSGRVMGWNAATGARLFNLNDATRTYLPPTVSPDGKYMARLTGPRQQPSPSTSRVDTLEILDAHSGQVLRDYHLNVPGGTGVNLIWLPDNMRLLTIYMHSNTANSPSDSTEQVNIWNIFAGQTKFVASSSHAMAAWTTSDGQYLIIGSNGGRSMQIWQTSTGRHVAVVATPGIQIDPYAIFAINNQYLVVGEKSSFHVWDIATGKLLYKYQGITPFSTDGNGGGNVFWSPDGKYLTMIAWKTSSIGDASLAIWRMP